MKVQGSYLQCFLSSAMVLTMASQVAAQALHVDRLESGVELVVVAQPLADATTIVWPTVADDHNVTGSVTSGDLTLIASLEAALAGENEEVAPPVIVAVGGVSVSDLRTLLDRILADRPPAVVSPRVTETIAEGQLERRLGVAGSDAELRLEVALPRPSDPMRSAFEVLWDLLPELLASDLAGVRSRIEGRHGLLEARTESVSAEIAVSQLRLGMARLAENPVIQEELVESAARRLRVRRQARLEEHPASAEAMLDLWLEGGVDALREFLFGVEGVSAQKVRAAASLWLPRHPGNIIITLPPRSFNPRFATPPAVLQLDSGLSAAVLERSGAPLATLCLRPVVVPDLDDELAATVLARVARELRELKHRPGWVRVDSQPAQILLAAAPDDFSELFEVLRFALTPIQEDERPVMADGASARRRALRLMARVLGVAEGSSLSPAALLRTGNLALGVVAEDMEAASEAVHKFWSIDSRAVTSAAVGSVSPVPKIREAAIGEESVLVVAVELSITTDEPLAVVLAEVLASRGPLLGEGSVEVLSPFVPGHRVLLVVASARTTIDEIETTVADNWAAFTEPVGEEELAEVRRRVAAGYAGTWSGTTGRARRCAAVASGAVQWRTPSDLEMAILSVPIEAVNATLGSVAEFQTLHNTGAGVLPIVELDREE